MTGDLRRGDGLWRLFPSPTKHQGRDDQGFPLGKVFRSEAEIGRRPCTLHTLHTLHTLRTLRTLHNFHALHKFELA